MAKHGLEVFDNTLNKTYDWLNSIMRILKWDEKQKAYIALRATLHALRDRLPLELAVKFGAQLPMLVRGFYYEGWKPAATPIKIKSTEDFLDYVAMHFANTSLNHEMDTEAVVRAVFQVIAEHISEGEINHLKQVLPFHIAALWPSLISG